MEYQKASIDKRDFLNQFKKILLLVCWFVSFLFLTGQHFVYAASLTTAVHIENTATANYIQSGSYKNSISNTVAATTGSSILPAIDVQKTVSNPVVVNGQRDVFDMTYTIKATNNSDLPATYVHLADNLNCAYRMYETPRPVLSWSLTQKPQVIDGPLVINRNYTGNAPCESDKITSFDPTASIQLVNGLVTLQPHASATLTYSVRIVVAPDLLHAQRNFTNTVYAATLRNPNNPSTISAASSAAMPVVPIDPSGVVYDSVTRAPIPGATVTLKRSNCLTGGVTPIKPEEIFNPFGFVYTYNADGSISQVVGANGAYDYFFNKHDDCHYQITVTPPSGYTFPSTAIPVTPGTAPAGMVQLQVTPPAVGQNTNYYFDVLLSLKGDVWNNHIPLDPVIPYALSVVKDVAVRPIAHDVFELDYTITAKNTGIHVLDSVKLADNLDCAFEMDKSHHQITAWQLMSKQVIRNGNVISDGSVYTGYRPGHICDRLRQQHEDPTQAFDPEPGLNLLGDHDTLQPQEQIGIHFTVRITVDPVALGLRDKNTPFTNKVHAGSFEVRHLANVMTASAMDTADALLIDPTGVLYDSVTRIPISSAKVIFTLDKCNDGKTHSMSITDLAKTGEVYTQEGNNAVSMITGADGGYRFIPKSPLADSDCEYSLSVVNVPQPYTYPSWFTSLPGFAPEGNVVASSNPPPVGTPLNNSTSRYYLHFQLGPSHSVGVFNNHIPLDPPLKNTTGQLLLDKQVNKAMVELGDSAFYTLNIKNISGGDLSTAIIKDVLPRGFRLIPGSVRLGGNAIADPLGTPGAALQFNLANLTWKDGDTLTLTYLVQVGVGASLEKTSVNQAQVFSGDLKSNPSSAAVVVTGGVFSDEAYLIGKVYLENCKADKVQNKEDEKGKEKEADELGIPGVRLLLEDGTSVVTDVEGKYSLYGLSPITHVLKLDATTLPKNSRLIVLSNRNSGKGDSRFVDLKKGELHKADFAVNRCDADSVVEEVLKRRKALEQQANREGEALIRQKLDPSYNMITTTNTLSSILSEARAKPASGILTPTGIQSGAANTATSTQPSAIQPSAATNSTAANSSVTPVENSSSQTILPPADSLAAQRLNESNPNRPSVIPLEEEIKNLDNKTGFINLKEGDTLPTNVINVRVKGMLGANLQLRVNGEIESARHVGKKSNIAEKKLEAWEYIGVTLKAGSNKLLLEVADGFGNIRDSQTITVIAPGKAGRVEIDAPQTAAADFKTPVKIKIRLIDDNGVPVTTRTQLTLETTQGRFENKDLNPNEPGVQAFMEGGIAEFNLIPPGDPKDSIVRVTTNNLQHEVKIAFLPELRPLIGAGIIEGTLDLSRTGKVNVNAPTAFDAFERELRNLSVSGNDMRATGRAAFYFKGTIKGEYLLTAAYDSDKDTKQRLFRDIQPAKFYPIYGDSSLKSFDAQSTQRMYLRVDKQKSYLLYGDFTTAENNESRKLSQYSRSVTGVKTHYEQGDFKATAFASRDNLTQAITEIPANGTSGPYKLTTNNSPLYENSEKVEILVRDKNQPSVILESQPMARFSDYAVDPLTNEIFFKGPVASMDANLNPRTIRVTYEVRKGGQNFWMVGGDARLKVTDYLELGASYARDENPQKKSQVMGTTAIAKLGDKTTLIGEVARTVTQPDTTGLTSNNLPGYFNQNSATLSGEGWAQRLQLRHSSDNLRVDAQVTHASKSFNNPTAGFSSGRTEATLNSTYKIANGTNLKEQAIYSKDQNTGGSRAGIVASIEHAFDEWIKGELGLRAAHETLAVAQVSSVGTTPNSLLAIRAKLSSKLPWINGADVYGEAEQDVLHSNRHILAVGAGYLLNDKTRLYGRYQFMSSISNSAYGLNSSQQNNVAVFGVESTYIADGRLFSEYRVRDAINGRESQAAVGLRQTWAIADGLKLGGSFEMTHAFAGQAGSESKAITALAEYTADPRYKLTGSLEARFASMGNSYLNTLGFAYKIDDDWSLLARNTFSMQETKASQSALWRTRQQIGLAWRQVTDNRWNALGRYEHLLEKQVGGINPYSNESHIVSTHVNYQPHRDVITSGRYAVKWSDQFLSGITSHYLGHLLYGRTTWDFLPDWDMSVQAGMMADKNALQYATGLELGYQAVNDLWVSAGYNIKGFNASGLQGTDYTAQGFYVRMRFKFDEGLFE